jgi:hypothetical protein
MFNKKIVYEALKLSRTPDDPVVNQDSLISLLIHDIFGGEILKTKGKEGWHFYNRIDGNRIDFTLSDKLKHAEPDRFQDIPASPDETSTYVEQVDYSTFLMKFIRVFEESVGLEKLQPGFST